MPITILFEISQKFFHFRIQHDQFSRVSCIYVSNYDDEIMTLTTSSGLVLGPTKSSSVKICSYKHALQNYHKFSRGELVLLGIRFFAVLSQIVM